MANIICAPDSFKGTLSAYEAANVMAQAVSSKLTHAIVHELPIGDGGEGTARVLAQDNGRSVVDTHDPCKRPIQADYYQLTDGSIAIDIASASGLYLIGEHERDPINLTTAGTGRLIRFAIEKRPHRIFICLGGTATVDGGAGLLAELGARFYDNSGVLLDPYGTDIDRVESVDLSPVLNNVKDIDIIGLSDVDNVLTGQCGAARVFGPQKGAPPATVDVLDRRLDRLGRAYARSAGIDTIDVARAGAAGGAGAALLAIGGKLRSGIDVVLERLGFADLLPGADLILTGEGKLDSQTYAGKAIDGVCRWARDNRVSVVAIAGQIDNGVDIDRLGLLAAFPLTRGHIPGRDETRLLLKNMVRNIIALWNERGGWM